MDGAMPPVIMPTATLMGETVAALLGALTTGYDLHSLEMASVMPCAIILNATGMEVTVKLALRLLFL